MQRDHWHGRGINFVDAAWPGRGACQEVLCRLRGAPCIFRHSSSLVDALRIVGTCPCPPVLLCVRRVVLTTLGGVGSFPRDPCTLLLLLSIPLCPAACPPPRLSTLSRELSYIQHALFQLGAHLATPPTSEAAAKTTTQFPSAPAATAALESWMDAHTAALPPLTSFILPGGSLAAAALHTARTVARRAEREATNLVRGGGVRTDAYVFLNRLSDYLFVAARAANAAVGVADCTWDKDASPDALAAADGAEKGRGGAAAAPPADTTAGTDAGATAASSAAAVGEGGAGATVVMAAKGPDEAVPRVTT